MAELIIYSYTTANDGDAVITTAYNNVSDVNFFHVNDTHP